MKRLLVMSGLIVLLSLVSSITVVAAPDAALEGDWQSSANPALHICFYGNQVGSYVSNGVERCFLCIPGATTNSFTLYYGGEQKDQITCLQNDTALTITDSQNISMYYQRVATYTNACKKNIMQMTSAMKICRQDNPSSDVVAIPDMMRYLRDEPVCPNGGVYLIQPGQEPICSMEACGQ